MKSAVLSALVLFSACDLGLDQLMQDPDSGFAFDGGFSDLAFCSGGFEDQPARSSVNPPPISGGSMAALADGTVIIGDVDRDLLWVVQGDAAQVRQVALPAGSEPGRIVAGPEGTAYLVLRRRNQLVQLVAATGALRFVDTCSVPRALIYQAARGRLVVGCADGTIATHTGGVRGELQVSAKIADLRDLVDEGDQLIATSFRSAKVFSIAAVSGVTTELAYTGLPKDGAPRVAWRAVGTTAGTLVSYQTERVTTLPPLTESCGAYGGSSESMPSLVASSLGLVRHGAVEVLSMIPMNVLPVDLAANAAGDYVVVGAGSNSLAVSWSPGALGMSDGGVTGFGGGLSLTGQPVAVVTRGEQWVVFEREPAGLAFVSKGSLEAVEVALPGASAESTGHTLFHRATLSNIACASCHPEAGDDEHVWQFAEGARRTPTLRGGLAATAPFHWSGDEADMPTLIADVMVRRMTGSQQTPDRARALLSWLDAQQTMPAPPTDAPSVARGLALFSSPQTRCTSCHTGAQGTNNATVDVGTGAAFQVPRLVELGWRTQWFHDGRVTTPADRFGAPGGGDAHGHTSQLSAAEQAELLEYLRSR